MVTSSSSSGEGSNDMATTSFELPPLTLNGWQKVLNDLSGVIDTNKKSLSVAETLSSQGRNSNLLSCKRALATSLRQDWQWRQLPRFYEWSSRELLSTDKTTLQKAISFLEEGIEEHTAKKEHNEEDLLSARFELALLFHDIGRKDEALNLLERVTKKAYDQDAALNTEDSNNEALRYAVTLNKWYMQADNRAAAISVFEAAAGMSLNTSDRDDPADPWFKNPLLKVYAQMYRLQHACSVLERTIQARERLRMQSDPHLAFTVSMLDDIVQQGSKLEQAKRLLEEADYEPEDLSTPFLRSRLMEITHENAYAIVEGF